MCGVSGKYEIECGICDITTVVEVLYDNDHPQHCPMCGEDAEPEFIEGVV